MKLHFCWGCECGPDWILDGSFSRDVLPLLDIQKYCIVLLEVVSISPERIPVFDAGIVLLWKFPGDAACVCLATKRNHEKAYLFCMLWATDVVNYGDEE